MKRREFPPKVKLAAWERSNGRCESCQRVLVSGDINYDHIIPDGSGGEPTLDNCSVVCRGCHGAKTVRDVVVIAKGKRVRRRHLGIKHTKRPFPGGRDSPWKRTIDGRVVRRRPIDDEAA